jgi:hypothetical protein
VDSFRVVVCWHMHSSARVATLTFLTAVYDKPAACDLILKHSHVWVGAAVYLDVVYLDVCNSFRCARRRIPIEFPRPLLKPHWILRTPIENKVNLQNGLCCSAERLAATLPRVAALFPQQVRRPWGSMG